MKYIRIRNWGRFQHYKDREPKWIKLYRSLLNNYEFSQLTDQGKGHLLLLWLLAAEMGNKIPYDNTWIKNRLQIKGAINYNLLINLGFIELYQNDSELVQNDSELVQNDSELVLREEERREEKNREDKKEKFTPPLINEVIKYFQDNGYPKELATHVYKYYAEAEPPWTDSKGNKVRGWKQKMRGVWFKSENKQKRGVDIQPKTYAQAQDAERRTMVKILKEMENDGKQESDSSGTIKATHLLSHGETVS